MHDEEDEQKDQTAADEDDNYLYTSPGGVGQLPGGTRYFCGESQVYTTVVETPALMLGFNAGVFQLRAKIGTPARRAAWLHGAPGRQVRQGARTGRAAADD